MDYATKLKDERLIGIKEGEKIGSVKATKTSARNMIVVLKMNHSETSYIYQFVKDVFKDSLTDEEIQQMIDEVEENE